MAAIPESDKPLRQAQAAGVPRWVTPTTVAVALGVASALVLLNLATLVGGAHQPWLVAIDAIVESATRFRSSRGTSRLVASSMARCVSAIFFSLSNVLSSFT